MMMIMMMVLLNVCRRVERENDEDREYGVSVRRRSQSFKTFDSSCCELKKSYCLCSLVYTWNQFAI